MKAVWAWMAVVCGAMGAGAASAQTSYHCRDADGNNFVFSRPCPSGMRTTAAAAGPARSSAYSSSSYASGGSGSFSRSTRDEPEHYQYLSERCRSLNQAMRTGYSRGLKQDVIADMRYEYERDCREQEREAYSKHASERRAREKERHEAEKTAQWQEQTSRESEARFLEQCAESRRILQAKKQRTDLTPGEQADLRRFEDNFLQRCKR
ncbi:hypothetical protein [Comamonas granuli]|uniref:hypothetical protein n=1 Tax=Comamonas granuli TaxID=290309 RepID=UPI0005A86588|nr:hypothetical protein [Comamonas granuli]